MHALKIKRNTLVSAAFAAALVGAVFCAGVSTISAQVSLYSVSNQTVTADNEFRSTSIDASDYENLQVKFDYEFPGLDDGESVEYGYNLNDGSGDQSLGGSNASDGLNGGEAVNLQTAVAAADGQGDVQLYIKVLNGNGAADDEVTVNAVELLGDRVSPQPSVPVNLTPDSTTVASGSSVTLSWGAGDDLSTFDNGNVSENSTQYFYSVAVSTSSDFSNLLYAVSTNKPNGNDGTVTSLSPAELDNAAPGTYYWRVKALYDATTDVDDPDSQKESQFAEASFTVMSNEGGNDGEAENGDESIYGCTDEEALNYDPEATHDDEGCQYADETLPEQCMTGNLLDNASFETPIVEAEQNFAFIANPSAWLVVTAAAGDSADLEFHRGWQGNEAAAGAQYVELDGNESVMISQTVSGLDMGAEYTLFWDFAARQDTAAANNHLEVALDEVVVATSGPTAGSGVVTAADWVSGSHTFTATDTSHEVAFTDIGTDDSYGTFLDNTVLCQTAAAPEIEPEEWTWEGYKYRDETGAGELNEGLVGEPNWGMELVLSNEGVLEVLATTTTAADGSYEFTLTTEEIPEWARFSDIAVREEMRDGWTPTGVYADGRSLEYNPEEVFCGAFYEGERVLPDIPQNELTEEGDYYRFDMPRAFTVRCDFLNEPPEESVEDDNPVVDEEEDEEDGTTYGTRVRRTPQPEPQVLGAATSTDSAPQCGRLLHSFMQQGDAASEQQVQLLQIFLNGQGYLVPVTGEFDAATDAAVREFQQAHQEEVLVPWYEVGLMGHQNPTGYVYRTTRWKINNLVCPGSEDFPELR